MAKSRDTKPGPRLTWCLKQSQGLVPHVHPSLLGKYCLAREQAGQSLAPAVLLEVLSGHPQGGPRQCSVLGADTGVGATRPHESICPGCLPQCPGKGKDLQRVSQGMSQWGQLNRSRAISNAVCYSTLFPPAWPHTLLSRHCMPV